MNTTQHCFLIRLAKTLLSVLMMGILASCGVASAPPPTFPPFPTMTPGQALVGALPTANPLDVVLANPATAVAIGNRPTATPNFEACPQPDGNAELGSQPSTADESVQAIVGFMQSGGDAEGLREALQTGWFALGERGAVRDNVDLTGEGTPEIVVSYLSRDDTGVLLVIGCSDGLYEVRYQLQSEENAPPRIVWLGEMNNAPPAELVVTTQACDGEDCRLATVVIGWNVNSARLVNLLDTNLLTDNIPDVQDIDSDAVAELVVRLTNRGNTATGPLRTGVNIYDWNGVVYTLSIIQLDAPRFLIQVVQQADVAFSQLDFALASDTYTLALNSPDLRFWYNDERDLLPSYILYRLILSYAVLGDARLGDALNTMNVTFPLTPETNVDDLPVFVVMAYRFAETFQLSGDLHQACVNALAIAEERPEALELLNRYGSRSPRYAELDLCPF